MMRIRKFGTLIAAFAVLASLLVSTVLRAQEENATDYDDEEVMEEIVVVVNKSGDPVDVDALYLDQLRTRVIKYGARVCKRRSSPRNPESAGGMTLKKRPPCDAPVSTICQQTGSNQPPL